MYAANAAARASSQGITERAELKVVGSVGVWREEEEGGMALVAAAAPTTSSGLATAPRALGIVGLEAVKEEMKRYVVCLTGV